MKDVVDCHIHLWREDDGQPIWVREKIRALPRTAALDDLAREARGRLAGVVVVQAAECEAETEALIAQAAGEPRILGVVGWADLTAPDIEARLDRLAAGGALKGVRVSPVFAPERDWLGDRALARGLAALAARGLVLDILVGPAQLGLVVALQERFPALRMVLNHGGRPVLMGEDLATWRAGIARVGRETAAVVKLSGLIERAGFEWTPARLAPAVDHLLETMGPPRLAFASNWPMLDLMGSWAGWIAALEKLLDRRGLDPVGRAAILAGTATAVYRLGPPTPALGARP